MPKINGNEIRPGNTLEHDGGLWAAVKVDHVKPGKGGAFAQVEMKNLRDGRKLNEGSAVFVRSRQYADLHGQRNLRADRFAC